MKLPIKKKYFNQIKSGEKNIEFRDAHITFVCEETKEEYRLNVENVAIVKNDGKYDDVCKDKKLIAFRLINKTEKGLKEFREKNWDKTLPRDKAYKKYVNTSNTEKTEERK